MSFEKKRLDITDRVTGRFSAGQMNLFFEKEQIGTMSFGQNGNQVSLKNGYEEENHSFFQYADVLSKQDEKYVDCDEENGWC
ncbi:YusG family protein [Metabacillus idriensis]|uniref:YusG family protein n=1 Tax=Metabacillus idriensis TaxID=324768 RepID=UPI002812E630|nr:YusG family protein [Metabacillus idriensis]MDR0139881.1 YusG family protein [Metabacillus idriensis]